MTATVKFDADGKPIERALDKGVVGANKVAAGLKAVNREAAEVNRLVQRGFKENETATEKWRRQVDALNNAFKSGKINQKQLQDGLSEVNRETNEAANATSKFELAAVASAAAIVVAFKAVKAIYADVRQEAEGAAETVKNSAFAFTELAQVSTSQADFNSLVAFGTQLRSSGAVDTLSQGAQTAFALRSAGLDDDRGTFQRVGQAGLANDLAGLAKSVATVQQAFGKLDSGNAEQILAKTLIASGVSPENINQILQGTAQAGQAARVLGVDAEESLSAVSLISAETGSASTASTQVKAFFKEAAKAGLKGSLEEIVKEIQGRLGRGEILKDIIGDSTEAQGGFLALTNNLEKYNVNLTNIRRADENATAVLNERLSFAENNQLTAAGIQSRQAEGALESDLLGLGGRELQRQAIGKELRGIQTEVGDSAAFRSAIGFGRGAVSKLFGTSPVFGNGEDVVLSSARERAEAAGNQALVNRIDRLTRIAEDFTARRPSSLIAIPTPEAN